MSEPAAAAAGFAFGMDLDKSGIINEKCDHGRSLWLPNPIV
jgi:hypothetical protein